MWRLKPVRRSGCADQNARPGRLGSILPGGTFSVQTTKLGLIRTARWFVARTQDFDGYTLFFISQFDGTLEKYFDDFTLTGAENLLAVWGQCVGCPAGPDVTARDIVEYIARGQIKDAGVLRRRTEPEHRPTTRRLTGTKRPRSSSAPWFKAGATSRTR